MPYVVLSLGMLGWLLGSLLASPAAFGAGAMLWMKERQRPAVLLFLASVVLLGAWTPYVLASLRALPEGGLWLMPACAVLGNLLAASASTMAGGGRHPIPTYLALVVIGLGPPLFVQAGPLRPGELGIPVLVWALAGAGWTLVAGLAWAWLAALRAKTPEWRT